MENNDKERIEDKAGKTPEEREDNGADMSDAREINEEMRKDYSREDEAEKSERLNEKEKQREQGSVINKEEV